MRTIREQLELELAEDLAAGRRRLLWFLTRAERRRMFWLLVALAACFALMWGVEQLEAWLLPELASG